MKVKALTDWFISMPTLTDSQWPEAVGSDQKKKVADAKGRSNHPPKCVWALPQTYLRSSVIQEEVGVKSLLLCIERWLEVV